MKTYTTEEVNGMRQTIEEQIWFDYIKKHYPVEADKLINEYSMRPLKSVSDFLNPRKILKFKDVEKLAGITARDNLKRYFYFLNDPSLKVPSLSDKEIARLYFVLSVFPFTFTDDENIMLTDILFRALEINRENVKG